LHHELALALLRHDWPGNVRELLAVLGRVASRRDGDTAGELRLDARTAALLASPPPAEPAPGARDGFVVARNGAWFDAPEVSRVSLESRKQLASILAALAEAHRVEPGRALSVTDLVAAGWPGERVLPRAGASRVYVSITSLRKMGLRDAIERSADGYCLTDGVHID
jgi:transcriptional regulator of acetoin/glycerol metabolism